MNIFIDFFQSFIFVCKNLIAFLNSDHLDFLLQVTSLCIVSNIVYNLVKSLLNTKNIKQKQTLFILFIIPLLAIISENISSIFVFINPKMPISLTMLCFAWMLSCFKFHSLLLFLEKLTKNKIAFQGIHKGLFAIEIFLCGFFLVNYINYFIYQEHLLLFHHISFITLFVWLLSIIPSVLTIIVELTKKSLPAILQQQLKHLLSYILLPHITCIFLEFAPVFYYGKFTPENHIPAFSNLGIILIMYTFYFCYKNIMGYRFLNLSENVQFQPHITVTTEFKDFIEQVNTATNFKELQYIAQDFFYEQFDISKKQVSIYMRNQSSCVNSVQKKIEEFLSNEQLADNISKTLQLKKILLDKELEFDTFCNESNSNITFNNFLQNIHASIFLPITHHKRIIGYITVEKDNTQVIYNQEQHNKMVLFAQFLAPALHMISQKSLYNQMQETKEIKEELYAKHQEVNQYKESIKKLLKDRVENHIGIIFYKNKHFSFRNKEAQQLIGINPNLQHSHPTAATLTNLAQQVEKFKSTQSMCITIHNGTKIMVTAMPYTEPTGGVVLTVRYPEATDIIKLQLDALKDPSKRDYLLYLETTTAGKIINKLIPSNSESLLQFKIQLLETALQKKALLLRSHPDDLNDMVKIIHEISLKEPLYILNLEGKQDTKCSIKLFGINTLLQQQQEPCLFEKLNQGTLFIKNIEHLDLVTQHKLAYFIKYGIYTPLKSEQRKFSNVRIICSTNENAHSLLQSKQIIPELYQELQKSSISLPSLLSIAQEDICDLVDGYVCQAIKDHQCKVPLTIKDKDILLQKRIESFAELKQKIHSLMLSKKESVQEEKLIPRPSNLSSELELAAQLGKHALKDQKLMTELWNKLGSQSKIAEILGVNRSSVNRRCKDYNLI